MPKKYKYRYGLIDGNYLLFRNKSLLQGNYAPNPIPKNELLKVTLQSFMKLQRERNFQYGLILWDSSPYFKTEAIKEYKADRYQASEDEIVKLKDEEANLVLEYPTASPERQVEISRRLVEIKNQILEVNMNIENFKIAQEVKYGFLEDDFNNAGFKSVLKKGYEADDHAYLLAYRISSRYQSGDKDSTAILCTADKDWVNFQMPGIDFVSTYYGKTYPEYLESYNKDLELLQEKSLKLYNTYTPLSMYEWGILYELSGFTHNNATVWDYHLRKGEDKLDWHESMCRMLNGDTTLPGYDILSKAFMAMNMLKGSAPNKVIKEELDENGNKIEVSSYDFSSLDTKYIDDTTKLHNFKLADHKYVHGAFQEYCQKNWLNINMSTYYEYVSGMDCVLESEMK